MMNQSPLSVLARWDQDLATLVLEGELDVTSAPQAEWCLDGILSKHPSRLVVDLAGLMFMDAQGIKLIARARRGLPAGRSLVVCGPNLSVRRVLAVTGIDQVCTIEGWRLPPRLGGRYAP